MKGYFISFEGMDGSGKTSVLNSINSFLINKNKDFILTREPGGNKIAELIRNVILNINNQKMDKKTEALLYAASRRQHLVETILPALEQGKLVLSDRFTDSSLAYQGAGRKIGVKEVYNLNLFATDGVEPNLTIYLDVDPEMGMQRVKIRGEMNRLDKEKLAFYEEVRASYLDLAKNFSDRIVVIDANKIQSEVIENVFEVLKRKAPKYFMR